MLELFIGVINYLKKFRNWIIGKVPDITIVADGLPTIDLQLYSLNLEATTRKLITSYNVSDIVSVRSLYDTFYSTMYDGDIVLTEVEIVSRHKHNNAVKRRKYRDRKKYKKLIEKWSGEGIAA